MTFGSLFVLTLLLVFCPAAYANNQSYSVGEGSGARQAFFDTYFHVPNSLGHRCSAVSSEGCIGKPLDTVHSWYGGCVQDFYGGYFAKAALMQPGVARCNTKYRYSDVYAVVGEFWAYYEGLHHSEAARVIGYPTDNAYRWPNDGVTTSAHHGWAQDFLSSNCSDCHGRTMIMSGDKTGVVVALWGQGLTLYQNSGGATGPLGYPTSGPYWQDGLCHQRFENGQVLQWGPDPSCPVNSAASNASVQLPSVGAIGSSNSRESRAVRWATIELNSPDPSWSDQLGVAWSGMCEAFVEIAYGKIGVFGSAFANFNAQKNAGRIHTDDPPPLGALVFYDGGHGFGHVAISIGNDQIITTWGFVGDHYPIRQTGIHSLSNHYLGWAYAPDSWSGRQ